MIGIILICLGIGAMLYAVVFLGALLVQIAVLPSIPVWILARSFARRLSGNEDNDWVVTPAFVAMMLALVGIDWVVGHAFRLGNLPDSSVPVIVAEAVVIYCLGASVVMIGRSLIALVVGGCGALFEGLNHAIGGEG